MNALVFNRNPNKLKPSIQQEAFYQWVTHGSGSVVLEAVAGGGKTSTLCEAIRIMTGTIFFGAFSKKIADELTERVGHLGKATISTFHAFGRAMWKPVADKFFKVEGDKCRDIFRNQNWNDIESSVLETPVLSLVSFAKQAGIGVENSIDDDSLWHGLIDHFGVETFSEKVGPGGSECRDRIIRLARDVYVESLKQCKKVIDFDDMILAPLFFGVDIDKFDWLLIDEAQDTNRVRRIMAKRMMHANTRLVAVGDSFQAIFGFTGADSDSLIQIREMSNAATLPLSFSFRCPKAVVAHARNWAPHIQAAPTAKEGLVEDITLHEMTMRAQAGDMVLSRFNAPLMKQAYGFIMAGKAARVEGKEIGAGLKTLIGRWKVKSLDVLVSRLRAYMEREVKKHTERENRIGVESITDRVECALIIVDRVIQQKTLAGATQRDVIEEIDRLFGLDPKDPANRKPAIVLSSIHKAKGLEFPRVFWLQLPASPFAKKEWEKEQENHLKYVAATRAMEELYLVEMPARKSN